MRSLLLFLLLLFSCVCVRGQEMAVIPAPQQYEPGEGMFDLSECVIACPDKTVLPEAVFLQKALDRYGITTKIRSGLKKKQSILLLLMPGEGKESYRLEIDSRQLIVRAADRAGMFYGIQTLLQLIRQENNRYVVNGGIITDAPRYAWRGFMLDESRHFFGKEKVKQLLDFMAMYKLNKLHWHLTDEPGWRIEIKKYPRLTTIGGKGNWSEPDKEEVCYYTQDDIKEIIAYAADRHIEIIPEIDMPGHATAANMAYPEMSGGGTPDHPEFTFNVGKEEVYAFLTDILREVSALFPSHLLHIGGDEVSFGIKAWETDPHVQALMKREGLKTVKEAERYFMHRMADSVKMLGKTLVGWDELIDLSLKDVQNTWIMWWRHDRVNQLKKSLSEGYSTIMCPRRPLYFDFIQREGDKWGRVWSGFCPIEDVYSFPDKGMASWQLPEEQLGLIRGIQANLWTERVHTEQRFDYMIFPRLCALAESAWTLPEQKNWDGFSRRMENAYRLFDAAGIYYFDHRNPTAHPEPVGPQRKKKEVPMDFRD